jgi:spermidine synthase
MSEDSDDHRRILDACPEPVEGAAMIFNAPPQFGQFSISISKTRLTSLAQLIRRRALRVSVIGWGLGCMLWRTRKNFTKQLRVRREHAMEADQM